MRALSAAVGLNVSTISYHVGSKRDLYREVFRRLFLQDWQKTLTTKSWATLLRYVTCWSDWWTRW